jgi:hypothetical protein
VNVYVCSTVRHLLFAVLQAAHRSDEQHQILLFTDYQDAGLEHWDLSALPANARVVPLERAALRTALQSDRTGRMASFFAMRGWPAPPALRRRVQRALHEVAPAVAASWSQPVLPQLWLFNERNKMARLFRLLQPRFALLEEGEGNYTRISMPWWKWPVRALQGLPPRVRQFGEARNCTALWVLYPERLAAGLRHKAHAIEFLHSAAARELMQRLFGASLPQGFATATVILATQPLEIVAGVTVSAKQGFYTQLVEVLLARNERVILKAHPAESGADYSRIDARVMRTVDALPLEVLLLASPRRLRIVSVISTAGLGFEAYCERIKLCPEGTDTAGFAAALRHWLQHPDELRARLTERLDRHEAASASATRSQLTGVP